MSDNNSQVERLRLALSEVRDNRSAFSSDAFTQIVIALLDRLRKAQTVRDVIVPASDEIRLVTVMFVDIVDSTSMAQTMDNSDWKIIINKAHTLIATIVNEYDGQVGQYLGDGVLCFFGARHSRSDDAFRAVSSALSIQNEFEKFANEVFLSHGKEFSARIAITTGRLVVGMIGTAAKRELLALGPATNLASRLQNLSPARGIAIDSVTYARVKSAFIFDAQEPVTLKGFDLPIQYYLVIARQIPTSTQITTTMLMGLDLPFVNRQDVIQTIQEDWQRVLQEKRCYSIMVRSSLGMGKSRLLNEIMYQVLTRDNTPVLMVAHYERRNTSYNLLRDMLLRVCNLTDDTPLETVRMTVRQYVKRVWQNDDAEVVATIMAYMAGFGGESSSHVQPLLRGGNDNAKIGFAWVLRFLQGIAGDSPLLLLIDNLQWIDNDSYALLQYLLENLRDQPTLVLMTRRDNNDGSDDSLIPASDIHRHITLAPLDAEDTAEIVNYILSFVQDAPKGLVQLIQERAEGNPLFVIEFLGMLFDNGVFAPIGNKQWRWDRVRYEATASHLPEGLIGVLQARLDDLPAEARQVLQVAAVIGQTFWLGCVSDVTALDARNMMQVLVDRDMVYPNTDSALDGEEQYTFRHSLYRNVAYDMIPRAIRESYHNAIAQWLVIRIAGKTDYYSMLAEQFAYSGQYEASLFTYLEAIQNRVARGMLSEAQGMIDIGLSLARNVPREVALTVVSQFWTIRASIYNELLRYDEAIAASDTAISQLNELDDYQLMHVRAEAARMLGIAYRSQGHYAEAMGALSQAFEIMSEDNTVQLASLLRSFGSLSLYMGLLDEALAYQQRSYEAAQRSQDQTSITGATMQLGLIALEQGRIADSLQYFHEVLFINYEREYKHFQVGDLRNIGQVYFTLMHYERALAVYEEARGIQHLLGAPDNLLDALHGLCLMQLGETTLGMEQVEVAARNGHVDVHHLHLLQLTYIQALYDYNDYAQCASIGSQFLAETPSLSPLLKGRILYHIGRSKFMLQDDEARADLEAALAFEVESAGRDAWLIHMALAATYHQDDLTAQQHRQRAAHILHEWYESLAIHPDLQYAFLQNPAVQSLFALIIR